MQKRLMWTALLLIAMVAVWGCSDDGTSPTPEETAFEAMVAAGKAYVNDNAQCPGVLDAQNLHDNLEDYTVIDIRSEADYLAGHIPGAYHSSLGTLLADLAAKAIPADKPYVVACYTGQSAGHAKIAMELMGYDDVNSLKFGMSSWSPSLDKWPTNCGDNLAAPETDNNNGDLSTHDFPALSGYDAGTVVAERVAWMLNEGFKGKSYADIMDNLDDYFILNYFGENDYLGNGEDGVPGHIPGAFQFTPYASLGDDQMLDNLPTDTPIIVYCWTGQHSSQITAYLNLLGYEAYSLKFGSNNLFHSLLTGHKWSASYDFELEIGSVPTPVFAAMEAAVVDYVNDNGDCPGVLGAQALYDNLEDYTVIDIRSQTDYDAGHITGAYHSSLSTLLTDVGTTIPVDLPMVVACYTGQSAGHAKISLELLGYEDVSSLKFGMSAWNTTLSGPWNNNVDNTLAVAETDNNNGDLVGYAYPELAGYDAGTVVADRVAWMLGEGFQGVMYADIMDNLEDYFVVNYFNEDDYLGVGEDGVPGHIPGAFQFTPYASMSMETMLGHLPTDMPIVVYCWTGQHSSQITAALNMLGYEALSLKFGSNNLFYDDLLGHKWGAGAQNDFPLETTPIP